MTDEDQIKIRDVRLCECGLPANHDSICRPNRLSAAKRLDDTRTEQESREREERHTKLQYRLASERRAKRRDDRSADALKAKVDECLHREISASTVGASTVGRSSRNSEDERTGPPLQQELTDDPRREKILRILHLWADRWLELQDEMAGRGLIASTAMMSGTEKDREVIEHGVGLSPLDAVQALGSDITGGPETVRRIRERFVRCMRDGSYPKADCKCRVCHRAAEERP